MKHIDMNQIGDDNLPPFDDAASEREWHGAGTRHAALSPARACLARTAARKPARRFRTARGCAGHQPPCSRDGVHHRFRVFSDERARHCPGDGYYRRHRALRQHLAIIDQHCAARAWHVGRPLDAGVCRLHWFVLAAGAMATAFARAAACVNGCRPSSPSKMPNLGSRPS
jgi:hypothetical protein